MCFTDSFNVAFLLFNVQSDVVVEVALQRMVNISVQNVCRLHEVDIKGSLIKINESLMLVI